MKKYYYLILCCLIHNSYGISLNKKVGLPIHEVIANRSASLDTDASNIIFKTYDKIKQVMVDDNLEIVDNPYLKITLVEKSCNGSDSLYFVINNKMPNGIALTISYGEIVKEFHLKANETMISECKGIGLVLSFPKKDYNSKLFNIVKFHAE